MKISGKIRNGWTAFSDENQKIYRATALSSRRQSFILDGNNGKSSLGFLLAAGAQL
jgi:hypothetical protein